MELNTRNVPAMVMGCRKAGLGLAIILFSAFAFPGRGQGPGRGPDPETGPDLSVFPHVDISNGEVSMKVFLPDAEKGIYRATRFDWSGIIGSLQFRGHEYFCYWKDRHDPYFHDALPGPVEGYIEPGPGFQDALPGGEFIRIGIGVLRKDDEVEYSMRKTYEILDHGHWEVEHGSDWISFRHTLESDIGYAYTYEKTIRLKNDGFTMEHVLVNTGEKIIETDQFNHNFFTIDGTPTGPSFLVSFPFEISAEKDPNGLLEIKGNELHYTKELREERASMHIGGFSTDVSDHGATVINLKTGAGISFTVDKPLTRMFFWSRNTTLCPENFIWISVKPGKEMSWISDYTVFTR